MASLPATMVLSSGGGDSLRPDSPGRVRLTGLVALLVVGCGPSPDDPLPPEDDLYGYSLAVVETARLEVPGQEARALYYRGQVHARFGFDDRAIADYREAIAADADFAAPWERIGFTLSQRGNRMAEAIDAYEQALRCNPDAPGVYTRLGLIFMHQGRPQEALKALKNEISRQTASAETFYYLGQVLGKQGSPVEAIQAFRRALERAPDMRSAHYALALELRRVGEVTASEESLKRFRELDPIEDASQAFAASDHGARERRLAAETWIDASDLFLRAAAEAASDAGPGRSEDTTARSASFRRGCIAALEEAVRMDPSFHEAWDTYFHLVRVQGDREAALTVAARASRARPEDGTWPYRGALIQLHLAEKENDPQARYREALTLLEDAVRKAPEFPEAHFQIARTILHDVRPRTAALVRKAIDHAKRTVELDPAPAHYDLLAYGYRLVQRLDLSRAALEEGIRKNPQSSELKRRLEMLEKRLERPR